MDAELADETASSDSIEQEITDADSHSCTEISSILVAYFSLAGGAIRSGRSDKAIPL